jgi:hypothetical protein
VAAGQGLALAPGEGGVVSLLLTPPADLPLAEHTGTLAMSASNAVVNMPFRFRALSDSTGALRVNVVDEFTYYAEGSPPVTNATVRLSDTVSGALVAQTNVDALGEVLLPALAEAFYTIRVEAPDHFEFGTTLLVEAGTTNEMEAFIGRQAVRYLWVVEPTEIEEVTRITLETTFETAVPMPVVVLDPSLIDLADFVASPGLTEMQVDLKISNHGLIAAQKGRLDFESHPDFTFTPLIHDVGTLPAQSSLTVPLVIRKTLAAAPLDLAAKAGGGGGSCQIKGTFTWSVPCGGRDVAISLSLPLINLIDRANLTFGCGGSPPGNGGSCFCGGLVIPGGGIGNVGYSVPIPTSTRPPSCDPCTLKRTQAIFIDCPLAFVPLPDLAGCVADGVSCYDAITNAMAAGGSAGAIVGAAYNCAKTGLSCIESGASELLGPLIAPIDCLAGIVNACEDLNGGGGGGATGPQAKTFSTRSLLAKAGGGDLELQPLLRQIERFRAFVAPVTNLLGDRIWLTPGDPVHRGNWFTAFFSAIETNSDDAQRVSAGERASLLALPLPGTVAPFHAGLFLDRWNRTMDYYEAGIFFVSHVPAGQSTNFLAVDVLAALNHGAAVADATAKAEGFADPLEAVVRTRDELVFILQQDRGGVCARVKLALDQDAVLSRDAFKATLEIENNTVNPLEEIFVEVNVRNEAGADATELFELRPPALEGLSAVNGAGVLPPSTTGRAKWILVPGAEAAPVVPVRHFVSGVLRYRQDGVLITIPLAAVGIDVLPTPKLAVDYFHERDVFSDDPFTPEVEPAIPFSLGVMVRNEGAGVAKNFRLISAQPRIVENDKGLLVNFEIIATEVAGVGLSPSLTATFGDVDPGQIVLGRWLFKSSLQGLFTTYDAKFEHVSGLGDTRFALIDSVNIHETLHVVQADRSFEDGRPDFLVNDVPDLLDRPDTLHLSSGVSLPVTVVTSATVDAPASPNHLTVQLTTTLPSGWAYLRVSDPAGPEFRLRQVRRSDNSLVAANTNVWRTDRTFIGFGQRPINENILHLVDFNSDGHYTLVYESAGPAPDTSAPVSSVTALSPASPATFQVSWSGSDNPGGSGLAYFDLFVSVDGGPFTNWMPRTTAAGAVFPGEPNRTYAFFTRATDANGNLEPAPAVPDAQTATTLTNHPPLLHLPPEVAMDEGETLNLTATASDPDTPPQVLTFALLPGAPAGATLNASSGRLTFPTGESTGPATNVITVRVADNGFPSLSATASMTLVVREVNRAPTLAPLADRVISEGQTLIIPLVAGDSDVPANALAFSFGPPSVWGAELDQANRVFRWTPSGTQGPSTNRVNIVVTDSGAPPLSTTQSFSVVVRDTRADFALTIGSTNLFAGESGAVPVTLSAGMELNELTFQLATAGAGLESLALVSLAPEITLASLESLTAEQSLVRFLISGLLTAENHPLAALSFEAATNAPSGIIKLEPRQGLAIDSLGNPLTRPSLGSGRVIVVNHEPVLLGRASPTPQLELFGRLGLTYRLEANSDLCNPAGWQPVQSLVLTNRSSRFAIELSAPTLFFRAVEVPSP